MNATCEDGIEQVRLLKINAVFRHQHLSDTQLQRYSRLALEAFFEVAARWQLPLEDQAALLELADELLPAWRAQPGAVTLSYAQLERISYILGIACNLAALMPLADANAWVRQPGQIALFNGQPPLALMKTGLCGLVKVHNYLYGPLF
jgi:hypothetical protein